MMKLTILALALLLDVVVCSDAFRGRYAWTPVWREHHIVEADGTVRRSTSAPPPALVELNELGHVASVRSIRDGMLQDEY